MDQDVEREGIGGEGGGGVGREENDVKSVSDLSALHINSFQRVIRSYELRCYECSLRFMVYTEDTPYYNQGQKSTHGNIPDVCLVSAEISNTLNIFTSQARTFDKALVRIVGHSKGGFLTLVIARQGFCTITLKTLMRTPFGFFFSHVSEVNE